MSRLKSPLLIVLVALVLRLGLLSYDRIYRDGPAGPPKPYGAEIGHIAGSLVDGHGFSSPYQDPTGPTAQQPPIYPFLLAGVFKLFGLYTATSSFVILSLNCLFSALTCLFLFLAGRRAFGKSVGALAAWAWVFWPSAVGISIDEVWNQSLAALLLSALVWATFYIEDSGSSLYWVLYGGLWGLAALTDPVILAALPFLVVWACYRRRRRGLSYSRFLATALALSTLVVLPWLVRNYLVFQKPVFIRDDFGLNLRMGNYRGASLTLLGPGPDGGGAEWEEYQKIGELAYMAEKRREAFAFIARHPGQYARLCLERFGEMWVWTGRYLPYGDRLPRPLWEAFYLSLPLFATVGLVAAFRERLPAALPLAFVLCLFPAVYVITHYSPPYRHPVEPEMMLLAAYALWRIANHLGIIRSSRGHLPA